MEARRAPNERVPMLVGARNVFGRGEIQRCLPACAASCSLGAGFQKREHQVRISCS